MAVLDAEPEPYFTLRPEPKEKNVRLRNTDHKVLKKLRIFLFFATVYLRQR